MEISLLKTVGQVAGLGGLSIGLLILIFRPIISQRFLPQLDRKRAYRLLLLIIIFTWVTALAGIAAWLYSLTLHVEKRDRAISPGPKSIPVQAAKEDEILILVAEFRSKGTAHYDISGRTYAYLEQLFGGGRYAKIRIAKTEVAHSIESTVSMATDIGSLAHDYNARIVIWGFYDDAGITPVFNLGRAMPLKLEGPDKTVKRKWEIHTVDYQIAEFLEIGKSNGSRHTIIGDQKTLGELPSELNVPVLVRDVIPRQMAFLSALALSFMVPSEIQMKMITIAVEEGERVTKTPSLPRRGYWRRCLAKAYSLMAQQMSTDREKLEDMIVAIEKAVQLDPENAMHLNNLGLTYLLRGAGEDMSKALAAFDEAIQLDPSLPVAFLNRARAAFACGEIGKTVHDLESYLALMPDLPEEERLQITKEIARMREEYSKGGDSSP